MIVWCYWIWFIYLKNLHFTAVNSTGLTIILLRCSLFHYLPFPILYLHLCVLSIIMIEIDLNGAWMWKCSTHVLLWDYHLNSYETDRDVYTEDYLLQKISYSLFVDVGGLYRRLVTNVLKSRGVWHLILSNALMLSASLSVIMHDDIGQKSVSVTTVPIYVMFFLIVFFFKMTGTMRRFFADSS